MSRIASMLVEHARPEIPIGHEFRLNPEPRQGRTKIVRDRGEHMGALVDETLQASLHGVKRVVNGRELPDCRAGHFGNFRRPPERIGRRRERGERGDQAARGENRYGGDDQRSREYQREGLDQPSMRRRMRSARS